MTNNKNSKSSEVGAPSNGMRVVILAGGSGTRLQPVTLEIPKPLLNVQKKPILSHLVAFFNRHGIADSIILIHKNHKEDYQWWKKRYHKELPKNLRIKIEPKPLGTFGGLKYLNKDLTESFILSNGDELKDFNLTDLIKSHKNNSQHPVATIALVKVKNPSDYGVPIRKGSRIEKFLEKPKNPCLPVGRHLSNFISSGLYVLEPEIFQYADWSRGFLMIEKDIFPKLADAGKLAGYKIKNGRWFDCGILERWEKAIKGW